MPKMSRMGRYSRRSGAYAKSRARAASRSKKSRYARVSRARKATITKIAKKAVLSTSERKYTEFVKVAENIAMQVNSTEKLNAVLINQNSAIYPSEGDSESQRTGLEYYLTGFSVTVTIQVQKTHRGRPLNVYLVRLARSSTLTTAIYDMDAFWPETQITAVDESIPVPWGRFNKRVGTIVRKKKVWPPKYYPLSTTNTIGGGDVSTIHRTIGFYIKVNRKIKCDAKTAEIPFEVPKYALLFWDANDQISTSNFTLQRCYVRAVYRDP